MKIPILGIKVDDLNKTNVLKTIKYFLFSQYQHYICTINPEFIMEAQKDGFFKYILNLADLSTADGTGIVFAGKIFGTPIKEKITGVDLTYEICKICEKTKRSVFLLGGKNNTAEKTAQELKKLYPKLKIAGIAGDIEVSNPKFLPKEVYKKIRQTNPDVLFVALGAPKQEKVIYYHLKNFPSVKIAIGVGGTFDFISKSIKRAPIIMQKLGLEWLYRLYKEPKRIKRIFIAVIVFPLTVLKWRIRMIFCYRKNVVGVIFNKNKQFLLCQRSNESAIHWQFPQGGVDKGENEKQALFREMKEELGTDKFRLIRKLNIDYKYAWPTKWHKMLKGYKGQRQYIYLLEFLGTNKDFRLYIKKEISKILWVDKKDLLKKIKLKRQELTKKILAELDNEN